MNIEEEFGSGLNEIQNKEYEVFKDILKIFQKKKYSYFITGGTVLGATYYNDFIPYDDDIDICMPRNDYNEFIKNAQKYLPDGYKVEHYTINEKFKYTIVRVENETIDIVELSDPQKKIAHPSIDIAPLDGVPKNKLSRNVFFIKLGFLRGILSWYYASSINTYKDRSILEKCIIFLLKSSQFIAQRLIDPGNVKSRIDKILSKNDFKDSDLAGTYMGAYKRKEMIKSDIWGKGKGYAFRDLLVNGPEKGEKYIKSVYGGFRELSPSEAIKARHYLIKNK